MPLAADAVRPVARTLAVFCITLLCGCDAGHSVLFTATRDNAAVLGLTAAHDGCEGGAKLAYLTNESRTLRGCWVRTKGDIRASFSNLPEIRVACSEFRGTELAERRNLAIESFEESPLHAVGTPVRH